MGSPFLHSGHAPVLEGWFVDDEEDIGGFDVEVFDEGGSQGLDQGLLLILRSSWEQGDLDDHETLAFSGSSFKVVGFDLDDTLEAIPVLDAEGLYEVLVDTVQKYFLIFRASALSHFNTD